MILEKWFQQAIKRGVVYYVTEKVARSGMSASFSLYVVDDDGRLERAWPLEDKGAGWEYSEKLASALGFSVKRRAWHRGGIGYNRVHDILYSMARHFGYDLSSIKGISLEPLNSN